jgi:hypothetical protein
LAIATISRSEHWLSFAKLSASGLAVLELIVAAPAVAGASSASAATQASVSLSRVLEVMRFPAV